MSDTPFISLLIVLAGVASILYGLTVFLLARRLTQPRRLTPARALAHVGRMSPGDLSMPFEDADFAVTDQRYGKPLKISAWWMPRPESEACAILIHGYADGKIGSIGWAPLLQSLGFNVLAIDLRAHGESEGNQTTAGYFERHDVSQIIDQLKNHRPAQTRKIILFGISMGAAVAAATANLRDDLTAIILDSPYAHFRDAAKLHADLTGLPGDSFLALGWHLAKWRTGAKFEEVDPARAICSCKCPVLIIAATQDALVSADAQNVLHCAITNRADCSQVWSIDAAHVLGYPSNPEEYAQKIRNFLAQITP